MRRQTDIALFIPFLGARGANKVMLDLANSFASRGLVVDFVLAEAKGELLGQLSPSVRLVDLHSSRGVLRSLCALARYLRSEGPTVLLTAMDYVNVLSLIVRRLCRVKTRVYVSSHNSLVDSARNSPWLRDRLLPLAVRLTYPWADGIVTVSNGLAELVAKVTNLPRDRVTAIYNPVVNSEFDRRASEVCDHLWFKEGEPPVVIGVGKLVFPKDFVSLIRAFAVVRQRITARLLILGDGEKHEVLQAEINRLGLQDQAQLYGFVSNPLPFVRAARLFVLSSRYEGFGLVIVEALACGTPVVATNCPYGPSEILAGGNFGRLVPTGDVPALAENILAALQDLPDREQLRQRGREFSVERATDAYLNLFGFSS
jgi:glycosyltransferase involved in cell wall biosynthesis